VSWLPKPHAIAKAMTHADNPNSLPAPCIIDTGILVKKEDMQRLLAGLGRVRYQHWLDGRQHGAGEGYVMEVFADPVQSTLVANHTLYLNVHSFDYLEIVALSECGTGFDLVQDNRRLRLLPLSSPLDARADRELDAAAIETMVAQVLSARYDVQFDANEDEYPF